jgi:hypothetical protein
MASLRLVDADIAELPSSLKQWPEPDEMLLPSQPLIRLTMTAVTVFGSWLRRRNRL